MNLWRSLTFLKNIRSLTSPSFLTIFDICIKPFPTPAQIFQSQMMRDFNRYSQLPFQRFQTQMQPLIYVYIVCIGGFDLCALVAQYGVISSSKNLGIFRRILVTALMSCYRTIRGCRGNCTVYRFWLISCLSLPNVFALPVVGCCRYNLPEGCLLLRYMFKGVGDGMPPCGIP